LGNASADDCADYCVTLFSDLTRKVTMQNLFHDGGFSSMGMSERAMIQYVDAVANFDPGSGDHARELKRWLSDRELLELSLVIGHWLMVACVLVPLEVELDEHVASSLPDGWREWL
jgi:alkylhydroperoxidase family enzyme